MKEEQTKVEREKCDNAGGEEREMDEDTKRMRGESRESKRKQEWRREREGEKKKRKGRIVKE